MAGRVVLQLYQKWYKKHDAELLAKKNDFWNVWRNHIKINGQTPNREMRNEVHELVEEIDNTVRNHYAVGQVPPLHAIENRCIRRIFLMLPESYEDLLINWWNTWKEAMELMNEELSQMNTEMERMGAREERHRVGSRLFTFDKQALLL